MEKNTITDKIIGYLICYNPISKEARLDLMKESLTLIDYNNIKKIKERREDQTEIRRKKSIIPNKIKTKVDNFVKVMSEVVPKENLNNLYTNLRCLKIVSSNQNKFVIDDGYYDAKKNKIKIYEEDILYSLLFQMSANDIKINNCSNGFYYETEDFSMGEGINRGYSELLSERYFGIDNKNDLNEKRFTRALEIIVGKKKFQKMYFNSDVYSLINHLKRYYTTKEIVTFIQAMDLIFDYSSFYYISDEELKILNKELQLVVEFLIKGYCIRLSKLNYSKEKNVKLIKEYFDFINITMKFNFNKNTRLNKEKIDCLINEYLEIKPYSKILQKK